jgi:hypothetical protein
VPFPIDWRDSAGRKTLRRRREIHPFALFEPAGEELAKGGAESVVACRRPVVKETTQHFVRVFRAAVYRLGELAWLAGARIASEVSPDFPDTPYGADAWSRARERAIARSLGWM